MTDTAKMEIHDLKTRRDYISRQAKAIQTETNQIDRRLLQLKWAEYPIGCSVKDDRGFEYKVSGYDNWWLLGNRRKKDGAFERRESKIAGGVVKIDA